MGRWDPGRRQARQQDLGVPLTAAELEDMADRARVSESLEPMLLYGAAHPKTFGGLYIDQANGGTIVVLVTDDQSVARWRDLAPAGAEVELRHVKRTLQELDHTHQALIDDWDALGRQGIDIRSIATSVPTNVVDVGIDDYSKVRAETLKGAYGPGVRVDEAGVIMLTSCPDSSCANPLRGGIRIKPTGATLFCTSSFLVRGYGGNVKMLTAGHCNSSYPIGTEWTHPGFGPIGDFVASSFAQNSRADAGLIDIPNGQGSSRFFVSVAQGNRNVTAVQNKTQEATGQVVCRSGVVTGYTCGTLKDVDFSGTVQSGITLVHQRRATPGTEDGDSGGPVYYGTTAKGVIVGTQGGTGWLVYTHIKEAKDALGWDHLCGMNDDDC